ENINGNWEEDTVLLAGDGTSPARFGWAVDVKDNYIFIGADQDPANGIWAGAAYVYKLDSVSGEWNMHQKITPDDIQLGDLFGSSVSVSGDKLLIGAKGADDNVGAAYIYTNDGTQWVQEARLTPLNYIGSEPYFGISVGLDGNYAIIGASLDDSGGNKSGAAFIFYNDGNSWSQQAKLLSGDVNPDDYFGFSVSLSGEYAIVGAVNAIHQTFRSGAAYIFKRSDAQWTEQIKLLDSNSTIDIAFGASVSLQGNYALIGVPEDDQNGSHSGTAYIYENDGTDWIELTKLLASDGVESDRFGWSVNIDEERAVVGAPVQYAGGLYCGAAYLYEGFVTGIAELFIPLEFDLYPVPAKDIVNCQLSTVNCQFCEVELYDVYGKLVQVLFEGKTSSEEIAFDVSDLPAGVYFIRMQVGERDGIRKLIIAH
ncbi:MAG: T9SS type A sorting domain-containing protein, partial [Bacteroidota bacterium]|nr:T9SS type A sorting domain-containing protein [Bacteroidota bacterium]